MNILVSTSIITVTSLVFSTLPFLFRGLRRYSRALNFTGGILLSFVLFVDVIPEIVEHGGVLALAITTLAFLIFLLAHHTGDSKKECGRTGHWLVASLAVHCLACGMLLCGSHEISETFAFKISLGLVVHKAVEAFALSSLLIERTIRPQAIAQAIALYTIAFPVGVVISKFGIGGENLEPIAVLTASVGLGALFGCLIQDFYWPVLRNLRFSPIRER